MRRRGKLERPRSGTVRSSEGRMPIRERRFPEVSETSAPGLDNARGLIRPAAGAGWGPRRCGMEPSAGTLRRGRMGRPRRAPRSDCGTARLESAGQVAAFPQGVPFLASSLVRSRGRGIWSRDCHRTRCRPRLLPAPSPGCGRAPWFPKRRPAGPGWGPLPPRTRRGGTGCGRGRTRRDA